MIRRIKFSNLLYFSLYLDSSVFYSYFLGNCLKWSDPWTKISIQMKTLISTVNESPINRISSINQTTRRKKQSFLCSRVYFRLISLNDNKISSRKSWQHSSDEKAHQIQPYSFILQSSKFQKTRLNGSLYGKCPYLFKKRTQCSLTFVRMDIRSWIYKPNSWMNLKLSSFSIDWITSAGK